MKNIFYFTLGLILLLLGATIFSYNRLKGLEEQSKAAWAQVANQYQRRADLIPNLVRTVRQYAAHETQVLTEITQARAKTSSTTLTIDGNAAQQHAFNQAQAQLTGALSHLIAVAESYPDLKASATFSDLMSQLEGTENRISTARANYIHTIAQFNTAIATFPGNLIANAIGLKPKENFALEDNSLHHAPIVEFAP